MNITKYNFKKYTPFIRQALSESDFIAIDFEFTGTTIDENLKPNYDDGLETVHWKVASSISKSLPTQIGIGGFKYESNKLTGFPFNFYIFPFDHYAYPIRFMSEVGSYNFLSNHNFDFNKWIYEGIGYIAKHKYENYNMSIELEQERLDQYSKLHDPNSPDVLVYGNSKFIQIRDWLIECSKGNQAEFKNRIDLALTPYKYFNSLKQNLGKMFPKHNLESKIIESSNKELFLEIKYTPQNINENPQSEKVQESLNFQLKKFIQYHKLRNTPNEHIKNEILELFESSDMIPDLDMITDTFE